MRINERCVGLQDCLGEPNASTPCGANTDPRLIAELTCPLSLIQTMGRSALQDGWNLLELSLGSQDPRAYASDIKAKFEKVKNDRPYSIDSFNAQVALDCLPLYDARYNGLTPGDEIYAEAYYNLAKTIQQLDAMPTQVMRPEHRIGFTAEYVAQALLVRGKKQAYPASFRSDKSVTPRYNHDIEVFGNEGKIPTQIKYDQIITNGRKRTQVPSVASTSRHGIRTVSMTRLVSSAFETFHRLHKDADLPEYTVGAVVKLIAEEANAPHDPGSTEAQLLEHVSETLYAAITDTGETSQATIGAWQTSDALNKLVRKRSDSSGNVTGKMNQLTTLRVATNKQDTQRITFDSIELKTTRVKPGMPAQKALAIAAFHGEYLEADDFDPTSDQITTSIILRNGEDITFNEGFTVDVVRKQLLEAPENVGIVARLLERLEKSKKEIKWQKPAHLR